MLVGIDIENAVCEVRGECTRNSQQDRKEPLRIDKAANIKYSIKRFSSHSCIKFIYK